MQSYTEIASTETLSNSLAMILNNDKTALSCSSGTAFPTANLQVGMLCFRTDQFKLYQLKNATPTWVMIADLANSAAIQAITGLASTTPAALGTAAVGTATTVARADHVHAAPTTVSGNAGTATKLATARNISLSGNASGSVSFDGSADATISVTVSTAAACSGNAATATTAMTASSANALNTANSYQVASLGVGTAASGTAGEIRATNNITAYYSDGRLKKIIGSITGALASVLSLRGVFYKANEKAAEFGYDTEEEQVGVIAQEVQAVLPHVVAPAPFDIERDEETGIERSKSGENYLTVRYERLVPLLIEAIKELAEQVTTLRGRVEALEAA